MSRSWIPRVPEPELMDDPREVRAYDEGDFTEVNRLLAQRAIALAGPVGRAVDLGTGPASVPLELCRLAPGWKVVAVDAGPRMLQRARQKIREAGLGGRIVTRLARVQDLGKRAGGAGQVGRFELVLSNSLLHHLRDPLSLWVAAERLLARGGRLVVQDLVRPASRGKVEELVRRHAGEASPLLRELFEQSLHAAFTVEEIEAQLEFVPGLEAHVEVVSDRHVLVTAIRKD